MQIYYISKDDALMSNPLDIKVITEPITMVDEVNFRLKNQLIPFDFLIIKDLTLVSNLEKIGVLFDKEPVTNYFAQTNLEHIYYLGNKDVQVAINHLIEGDFC